VLTLKLVFKRHTW